MRSENGALRTRKLCSNGSVACTLARGLLAPAPSRSGFTLVEVLVAAVLLGIGVTGLIYAATSSMRSGRRAHLNAAARDVACEQMAAVQTMGPAIYTLAGEMKGSEDRGDTSFSWDIAITRLSAGELHDVVVTVEYQNGRDRGETTLETWLSDYPAAAAEEAAAAERANPTNPVSAEGR